jgi:type I restriction enzyme M protein
MFEQAFKNIDDVLWKEAGCGSELDYAEQTSWLLFLKYLDGLEQDKAMEAELEGNGYTYILDEPYRWESWAAPKTADGKLDHNKALSGDDLRDFVDRKLFPYLHGFKLKASGPNTIEYKIGEIFGEIKNKIHSGYNLREIIDHIDELRFRSQTEKHELSHLYEAKIKNMGNAGRNGGEYYTPRPLIRAIVQVVKPKIGKRIYDGAVGSAGFLCEAFDYLKAQPNLTTDDMKVLMERTFYGKEKKSLAYVIAIMNMILHGMKHPTSSIPTRWQRTLRAYRRKTASISFWPILPLAVRSARRYSRTSRSVPAKLHSSFCNISSRCSVPVAERA